MEKVIVVKLSDNTDVYTVCTSLTKAILRVVEDAEVSSALGVTVLSSNVKVDLTGTNLFLAEDLDGLKMYIVSYSLEAATELALQYIDSGSLKGVVDTSKSVTRILD
jgi:hypothetical protein